MKKNNLDITAVRELHRAGFLSEAEDGYLAILRKNPRHIDALHSLGIIYAQREKFSDAVNYLQTAIKYQPNDPSLQLHLANILKMQGLFSQAVDVLQNTIQQNPDYAAALNNLGSVYFAQNKLPEAIATYRRAIALQPNYIDAYYNLGLTLAKHNRADEAIATFNDLLQQAPEHFAARFHLACLLMQKKQLADAITHFLQIEKVQPFHFETQTNLATCFYQQGALQEAKTRYLNALELKPEDTQILFNLGIISMQQGEIDLAIQRYQKAVHIDPDFFAAQNNLGVAFLAKQHAGFALRHFQEALRLQPHNKAIQYTVQMLSQQQPLLSAPPEYVKSLFDAYADHYEPHLLSALEYQVPALLSKAISAVKTFASHSLDILDMGCGTGLCGALFKPYSKSLIGVDLSEKMLAVAAQKNIYDRLESQDFIDYLADQHGAYDLILAGDVLVYVGDLERLFNLAHQALRKSGFFAFNAEICSDKNFKMNQSGRFGHSQDYLDQLARKYHFNVKHYETAVTRLQNNEPVYGHLYVLQNM